MAGIIYFPPHVVTPHGPFEQVAHDPPAHSLLERQARPQLQFCNAHLVQD